MDGLLPRDADPDRLGAMRNILFVSFILIAFFCSLSFAQTSGSSFGRTYTESGETAILDSIRPTSDGGYIAIGSAYEPYNDVILLKLDSAGRPLWQNNYVVSGQISQAVCIQEISSGYVALLALGGVGIGQTLMVMRLDSAGALVWQYTYSYSTGVYPSFIEPTTDGGFVVSAQQVPSGEYPLLGLKLDGTGKIVWQKGFGSDAGIGSIHATADGGAIVAGSPASGNQEVGRVLKLDAAGNTEWDRFYSFPVDAFFTAARPIPGRGFVVSGYLETNVITGSSQALLVQLDGGGDVLFTFTYGSSFCPAASATDVQNSTDGGYLLSLGFCREFSSGVARINDSGDIVWQRAFTEVLEAGVSPTVGGGFVAAGQGGETMLVLKSDAFGQLPDCLQGASQGLVSVNAPLVLVSSVVGPSVNTSAQANSIAVMVTGAPLITHPVCSH